MKSLIFRFLLVLGCVVSAEVQSLAFMEPRSPVLPDFDERKTAIASPETVSSLQHLEVGRLQSLQPGLHVAFDLSIGAPRSISSATSYLTGPNGRGGAVSSNTVDFFPANDRHRITKAFLLEHKPLFGFGPEGLGQARVQREFDTPRNGMKTVVWQQQVDGIALFDSVLISHVTRNGELISLSSRFLPDPVSAADRGAGGHGKRTAIVAKPEVFAERAVAVAAENIGQPTSENSISAGAVRREKPDPEQHRRFTAATLKGFAEAKLTWFPVNKEELRLCWDVVLVGRDRDEMYRVLVDVQTGRAVLRHCLTDFITDATYRVFASDSPSSFSPGYPAPTSAQPPRVARSLVTLSALDTNASPRGWIDDGGDETLGNNVDAHTDLNADNLPDLPRPHGSPSRVFDFPQDLNQAPNTYRDSSVVQLFFWCNWMHDKLYELGFTEAAGSFQTDNFGRGGLGDDAIEADAQDGSGVNNANFSTPPDGSPGRMQMYLFIDPVPARDGDLDAEIILHEYTHGLSNRRVGGGIGIIAPQSGGMGEGWSDFYALSLLSEPGDDPDGAYAFGAYASYRLFGLTQNYYFGIRRYPYCTDLAKNPLTFKDIDSTQASSHPGVPRSPIIGGFAGEVHNMGEIWCVTLWEARANLIKKYGGEAGNQLMLQLVTDGMNLAPPNPNFLEARDAILQADQVDTGGANRSALWEAFAKRGMGADAFCPASFSTASVRESFDIPDDLRLVTSADFRFASPLDGPFEPGCQVCWVRNVGSNTLDWVSHKSARWLTVTPAAGTLAPGNSNLVILCLNNAAEWLSETNNTASLIFSNVTSGLALSRIVTLQLTAPRAFYFSLETDPGWLREGAWAYGAPTGSGGSANGHPDPAAGATGANVFGVNLAGDYSTTVGTASYLTAGPFDFSGYTGTQLAFQRWLNTDFEPFVSATIDISQDGVNWFPIWSNGSGEISDGAWTSVSLDISSFADNRSNVHVRWGHQVSELLAFAYSGWNLDDIGFSGNPPYVLNLTFPSSASEGDGLLTGNVSVAPAPATNLTISFASSDTNSVLPPDSVIVPAGQTNAVFTFTVMDDAWLNGTRIVSLKATAPRCRSGSRDIQIFDNEKATLTVLLPDTVVKGTESIPCEVQLGGAIAEATEISLGASNTNILVIPASLPIPSGQTSAVFMASVPNDHVINGPELVSVTAQAVNWTDGTATLTILDNLNLVLTLPPTVREEEGVVADGGMVQISGILPTNLDITLTSGDPAILTIPAMVTILAGQMAGTFGLTPILNEIQDDDYLVGITASTPGFGVATQSVLVLHTPAPPTPANPSPGDGQANVSQQIVLSWESAAQPGATITNEIYFGTNPLPGLDERLGSTTSNTWTIPLLAPQTTYYWQVIAHQIRTTPGPVWHFTTRGLDHFAVEPISSQQSVSQPFTVSVSARDAYDSVVSNYSGTANFNLSDDSLPLVSGAASFPAEILWPTNSGAFESGRWSGFISVFAPVSNVVLVADDGSAHSGSSNPFSVVLSNDLSLIVTASPDPVATNAILTYVLVVGNSGTDADGVVLTNILSPEVLFISATASQGSCTETNGIVLCDLGSVTGITNVMVAIVVVAPSTEMALTNSTAISRTEPDPYLLNNSASVVTRVQVPPLIVIGPDDQIAATGNTAMFSVIAAGTEPLNYQWTFNTTNLPDATNAMLVLTNVQLSDAGSYAVLVTNAVGSELSSNALLTVLTPMFPPTIVSQPTNLTLLLGETANFVVVAAGTEPLSYQWTFNTTNLPDATNALLVLTNVQLSDAGAYAVLVTNTVGSELSSNALLTVLTPMFPPTIVSQPTNLTLQLGDTENFMVVAAGTEPLSYQWTFNTTNLPDATNALLVLTNVQLSDAGTYAVLVTNAVGSELSSNALLTVLTPMFPPTIVFQPTNLTLLPGDTASFVVVAEGSEPLSYQWTFNTTNLPDATNALLVLTNVQLSDAGTYAVLVTNAVGSELSSNALLTVLTPMFPPTIVSQPTNLVVSPGDAATFEVVATGTEPLAYQWTFNTTNLLDATNALLVLTNVQLSDSGTYAVLVTNAVGSELSSNALLTVLTPMFPPTIVSQPTNLVVSPGDIASFEVVAEGTEPLAYQWTFNGTNLPDATNALLMLASVQLSDAGTYAVLVTNLVGSELSSNALLTVQVPLFPPTIVSQPTNLVVSLGDIASFEVVAAGTEPLSYQWTFNTTNLPDATNALLALTNVQLSDAGDYAVLVTNAVGLELSSNALLTVLTPMFPPTIVSQPTNLTLLLGDTANFVVVAEGTEPLSYQWTFNTTNLPDATNALLVLASVQLSNAGTYAVLVTNAVGLELSSNALLTVCGVDHFVWNPISPSRVVNTPFLVIIEARDTGDHVATNFQNTVALGTSNGVLLLPTISGNFVQGIWGGSVVISEIASNVVLEADDGFGHRGFANSINIIAQPQLTLDQAGNTVILSWPMEASGFILETSTNLSSGIWTPAVASVISFDGKYRTRLRASAAICFYRLRLLAP